MEILENMKQTIEKLVELIGFEDISVSADEKGNRISVMIGDVKFYKKSLPDAVFDLNHLAKLIAKKNNWEPSIIDINNYLLERQELILELARAAARKVAATQEEIVLPPMNAYERRIIHTELAGRPDLKTESSGEGRERCVVVKPI